MLTSEQIAVSIVRDALGGNEPITPQNIADVAYRLGRCKQDHRAMTLLCTYFLMAVKNFNSVFAENGERAVLTRLAVFNPRVIFDVGANVGEWSSLAIAEMPGVHVHSFEIISKTFEELKRNLFGHSQVSLNNFGLFSREDEIQMNVYNASDTFSSFVDYPHGAHRKETCQVRTGDSYARAQGIAAIDFLKIDVEGAEFDILQGFSDMLDRGAITAIQFEYGRVNIMTHKLLYDFYNLLENKGYAVGKIYPDYVDFRAYALDDEDFLGPNYLACHRSRSDIIAALAKRGSDSECESPVNKLSQKIAPL
ncbi:MAG: FkbM family methyltransferase [Alphaproteobacteria bacterium]|nr:FkbM family methyltransferase [Alphaproteobacteria bacterium]